MRLTCLSLALLLAAPWAAPVMAQQQPRAVYADPSPDAAFPAGRADLAIPSGGEKLLGQILLPSGPGPHPLLVLLHGFPGYELSLDVGQAARRQGWAVVVFHYRGSWGSPGAFSFTHVLEDSQAALNWLTAPQQLTKFKLDPARVVIAGHSMGGFAALSTVAVSPKVAGLMLMDAWNPGPGGRQIAKQGMPPGQSNVFEAAQPPLNGTSAQALTAELAANADAFDIDSKAPAMAGRPVLTLTAKRGLAGPNQSLTKALQTSGAKLKAEEWPTDHSYSDSRIRLTATVLDWLKQFEAP